MKSEKRYDDMTEQEKKEYIKNIIKGMKALTSKDGYVDGTGKVTYKIK